MISANPTVFENSARRLCGGAVLVVVIHVTPV